MKIFVTLVSCGLLGVVTGIAHADVVAVVSAKSSVGALSKEQVSDIFLGKTSTFPNGSQAVPIDQAEKSAHREEFYTKVASRTEAQLKSYWVRQAFSGKGTPPKSVPTDDDVKKLVAANPNTIGYIDSTKVDSSLKAVLTP